MEDRGTCKIDDVCTGKKSCEVYQKLKNRFTIEETTKDACILYSACQHFNPIKWIEGPEDALEELLRMPAVMIDHPGARKLGALRFGIEATKKMVPKAVMQKSDFCGDRWTACPNCGQTAIVNQYRRNKEIYPYCPWCGQKLKEAENDE